MTDQPTYRDIREQATTWQATLEAPQISFSSDRVWILTGSGASYYAATVLAAILRDFGVHHATAVPASELWMHPGSYALERSIVVGISRTGTTTETVQATRAAQRQGAEILGVTLSPNSPLAQDADHAITLDHVAEQGRVMTRSFTSMVLAASVVVARTVGAEESLKQVMQNASARMYNFDQIASTVASENVSTVTFLGSGAGTGVAMQGALQLQETSEITTQAFPVLEYRHGPVACQDDQSIVILLSSSRSLAADLYTARDTELLGGHLVVCGPDEVLQEFPNARYVTKVSTGPSTDGRLDALAALPFVQLYGWHQTNVIGKSSEMVRNLDRTVEPHINPHDLPVELFGGPEEP